MRDSVREALSGRRFDVVFDNVYDWERGTTAAQVEATVRAVRRPHHPLHFHVERGRLRRRPESQGERSAGAGLSPDPYIRHKATTERLLFRMHASSGLPVVTFRPPFVYGPRNNFYREQFFWDRLRAGRPIIIPGDGHRLMQFVYVNDLVQAMVRSMEEPHAVGEAFNIGDPKPVTQVELVEKLAKAANVEPTLVRVPRDVIAQAGGNAMDEPYYFGEYFDLAADHREHRQGDARSQDEADAVRDRLEGDVPVVHAQSQAADRRLRVRRQGAGDGARRDPRRACVGRASRPVLTAGLLKRIRSHTSAVTALRAPAAASSRAVRRRSPPVCRWSR